MPTGSRHPDAAAVLEIDLHAQSVSPVDQLELVVVAEPVELGARVMARTGAVCLRGEGGGQGLEEIASREHGGSVPQPPARWIARPRVG